MLIQRIICLKRGCVQEEKQIRKKKAKRRRAWVRERRKPIQGVRPGNGKRVKLKKRGIKKIRENKFIRYLCFIADFIHSCYHCLKMSSLSLDKNKLPSIDLTTLAINVTTAFTIVNCLERELLEGFSVQGWRPSLKIFSILSNILDLE